MLRAVIKNRLVEEYLQEHEEDRDKIILDALIEFILKKKNLRSAKAEELKNLIKSNRKHYVDKKIDISDIANEVNL